VQRLAIIRARARDHRRILLKIGERFWDQGNAIIDASLKIVYRDSFQDAILKYVERYGETLPDNPTLQAAFIRKFDSLGS
jgi:hypothetical protein